MLAKIFGILLGVIGVTTTTVDSPTRLATAAPETKPPVVRMIEKSAISTNPKNLKTAQDKSGDFTKVKPPTGVQAKKILPKSSPKPKVRPAAKVNDNPSGATAPTSFRPRPATTTFPSASSKPLSTSELKNLSNPPVNFEEINQIARKAVVNIICTSKLGGSFEPLSASGVIIDPRGIILTNAHVAQYLLLQNYRVKDFLTCIARTGSPAAPAYTLKLLYISEKWFKENYKMITNQKPLGTGENDFALLRITGSTDPELNLPATFPALTKNGDEDDIKTGDPVLVIGYPAGFLGGIAIQRDLYVVSSVTNIGKRFTFRDGTLDAFSLGGSPVAQHGSSGGGAISGSGKLLGIIVTSTDAEDTSKRDLDAISIAHINRSMSAETGFTLDLLFASSISAFGRVFDEEILPSYKKLLIDELNSKNG